jgi:hypothetical protein
MPSQRLYREARAEDSSDRSAATASTCANERGESAASGREEGREDRGSLTAAAPGQPSPRQVAHAASPLQSPERLLRLGKAQLLGYRGFRPVHVTLLLVLLLMMVLEPRSCGAAGLSRHLLAATAVPSPSYPPPPPPPAYPPSPPPYPPAMPAYTAPGATSEPIVPVQASAFSITDLLMKHNQVRGLHGSPPLAWDDQLALDAEELSSSCYFSERDVGVRYWPTGQNFALCPDAVAPDLVGAVDRWHQQVRIAARLLHGEGCVGESFQKQGERGEAVPV